MTWFGVKQDLDRRVAETMAKGGYEARAAWSGRKGVIQCGVPGHEAYHFTVDVDLTFGGTATIKVNSMYDVLRKGVLRDLETDEVVPQRSFEFAAGDVRGMGKFVHELGREVQRWAAKREAREEWEARGDIGERLKELIAADPENAAETIAAILDKHLAPYQVESLREDVERAVQGTFSP